MKTTRNLVLQLFFVTLASGCGTVVGNPGGKKETPAVQDTIATDGNNQNKPSDSAYAEPAPDVSVGVGSVVAQPESSSSLVIFNPGSLKACQVEAPTSESTPDTNTTVRFTIDSQISVTDVKFYFYNGTNFVERNPLNPIEQGVYRIYALSYSVKKGCHFDVAIAADNLSTKSKITYHLSSF